MLLLHDIENIFRYKWQNFKIIVIIYTTLRMVQIVIVLKCSHSWSVRIQELTSEAFPSGYCYGLLIQENGLSTNYVPDFIWGPRGIVVNKTVSLP